MALRGSARPQRPARDLDAVELGFGWWWGGKFGTLVPTFKKRNSLGKVRLSKMVFVRRFIRLKRSSLLSSFKDCGFSEWVREMLDEAARDEDDDPDHGEDDVEEDTLEACRSANCSTFS